MHPLRLPALALVAGITASASAQTLDGTTWMVTLGTDTIMSIRFSGDTVYGSTDLVYWTAVSTYDQVGTSFWIVDLAGTGCDSTDTGDYTFQIQDDTLHWTLVADACTARTQVFTTFTWTSLTTGIAESTVAEQPRLYPVPAHSSVWLSAPMCSDRSYSILDRSGREVASGRLRSPTDPIPVEQLAPGAYLLRIGTAQAQRFVKE